MRVDSVALVLLTSAATALPGQRAPTQAALLPVPTPMVCGPAAASARAALLLRQAEERIMPASRAGRVLQVPGTVDVPLWEQSDRPYEPFIPGPRQLNAWADPSTGVSASQAAARPVTPRARPQFLFSRNGVFAGRDTLLTALPSFVAASLPARALNPWVVLHDWLADSARVTVSEKCVYRDFPRLVLARDGERLLLTEDDATPVALIRTEPHYLWGQVEVTHLWTTWWGVTGGGKFPAASFVLYDGTVYQRMSTELGSTRLVAADSAPLLSLPANPPSAPPTPPETPDTVRVAAASWLLRTRAYTHGVTLQRDTIFLLDATTSEARSRADSIWISRLFPGRHPIVLVVTDLAWPHIAGVRFWAARRATLVTHRLNVAFLRRVLDRRWTLTPDALERSRPWVAPIRAVRDSLALGGGAVVVHALRGQSTEGALSAWMPQHRFVWAGDYVQPGPDSPYASDVVRTMRLLGLAPALIAAQHHALVPWSTIER